MGSIRILLQTTIPRVEDGWHVGRFSMLADQVVATQLSDGTRVESSFHHFADYNWHPGMGAPSFVTEKPGDQVLKSPGLLDDVRAYVTNAARWLAASERKESVT